MSTAEAPTPDLLPELKRCRRERDALMNAWPEFPGAGPILFEAADGSWLLEDTDGNPWELVHPGPYPTREAAIRAAAGLTTEPLP
jgi:hypothetical protein